MPQLQEAKNLSFQMIVLSQALCVTMNDAEAYEGKLDFVSAITYKARLAKAIELLDSMIDRVEAFADILEKLVQNEESENSDF